MKSNYRSRLHKAAGKEFKGFWSAYRLWVALVGIMGPGATIFAQVVRHGIRSMTDFKETFENGVVGLIASLLGTYLISLWIGAKAMDQDWSKENTALGSLIQAQRDQLIAATTKPMRSAADRARLAEINQALASCEDSRAARIFLECLAMRPDFDYGYAKAKLLKEGMTEHQFSSVLGELEHGNLVLRIQPSPIRGNALQLNPEYRALLLEVLHGE